MEFKIDVRKIADDVVSDALETEIDGKTFRQWIEEIKKRHWISVKERLPDKSCEVITLSPMGNVDVHTYSEKWKSFNAYDWMDRKIIEKK